VLRALDADLITRPDDLYRIAREYLEDASGLGVRYSEFDLGDEGAPGSAVGSVDVVRPCITRRCRRRMQRATFRRHDDVGNNR
jgi:hypothetical protein